uniref:Protein-tyrosine-phosphatase n=1 Tax=Strombidium inclinatum TaxID=197538 RepID=A0A7S3N0E2_9SPIT|mmetsp:Transcript_34937/g.53633  ORF Transcript_34937/g.53633 Transcript_34937/m.53633 type:complete len:207 (+) Transcript_34937:260-880(+)
MEYKVLNLLDSPNQGVLNHVDESNEFITTAIKDNDPEKPQKKVLIHCFAGKSRATTFMLAYMIKIKKINLKDALERIREVRPIAAPNPGFMIQLKALEKNVLGVMSDVDVMQGMWKDKLDQLKKQKAEKAEAGELVSPLHIPKDEDIVDNAEKQLGLSDEKEEKPVQKEEKKDEKEVASFQSDAKELQDGLDQLKQKRIESAKERK